jgi:hypothetical protein
MSIEITDIETGAPDTTVDFLVDFMDARINIQRDGFTVYKIDLEFLPNGEVTLAHGDFKVQDLPKTAILDQLAPIGPEQP